MATRFNPHRSNATLRALLEPFVRVPRALDRMVSGLCLDSRKVAPADLFFAVPGHARDGASFIEEAVARGACAVVRQGGEPSSIGDVPVLCVPDARAALARVAAGYYGSPADALRVAAVTGTNGKTSVAHFIAHAMDGIAGPSGIIGTLGYGLINETVAPTLTTPDAITVQCTLAEMRERGVDTVAIEASSHALDQQRLAALAVEVAVFTNLSRDHLDYHGDMSAYGRAKQRLFELDGLRHAVINTDDPFAETLLRSHRASESVVCYGLERNPVIAKGCAYVQGTIERQDAEGLVIGVQTPWGTGTMSSRLVGRFNVYNILAAASASLVLNMPLARALAALSKAAPVSGRMERFSSPTSALVVVDYAHTPDALERALTALESQCAGKLWCVFGCGGDRDPGKRPLMGAAAARIADRVVLTDDNPRGEAGDDIVAAIQAGIPSNANASVWVERDRGEAIALAITRAAREDIVLVAGKGHEPYQEVAGKRYPFSDAASVRATLRERVT